MDTLFVFLVGNPDYSINTPRFDLGVFVVLFRFVCYYLNKDSSMKKGNLKKEPENKDAISACAREFNMVGVFLTKRFKI